jgi:hypothetical protein
MTSLTDALVGTNMIPPMQVSQLEAPVAKDRAKPPAEALSVANDTEMKGAKDKLASDEKNLKPEFPKLGDAPKVEENNDPIKGYVSTIGVLGAIGSMFTRRPLTNSMNAAAATLNAMKANDAAAFKQKFDEWKVQNDNAFKLLDYQQQMYDHILKNDQFSVEEKKGEMVAAATMFKDERMLEIAQRGEMREAERAVREQAEAAQKAQEYSGKVEEAGRRKLAFDTGKSVLDEDLKAGKIDKQGYARGLQELAYPQIAVAAGKKQAADDKEFKKNQGNYNEAIKQIDGLIDAAEKGGGMGVTGVAGMGERLKEVVETAVPLGSDAATPANDFKSRVETLKLRLPKLLTGTSKSAADERAEVANIVGGLGAGQTKDITVNKLRQLKGIFEARARRQDTYDTQHHKIGETTVAPDGRKMKITGFDEDGTPLGEEVK